MTLFTQESGFVRIDIEGERLDAAAAPALKAELEKNLPPRPEKVLVDISGVRFLDSTGLGVLVSLLKMMAGGGTLAIAGAQPVVQRLFKLTGMDRVFRLFESDAEAMAALAGDASPAN